MEVAPQKTSLRNRVQPDYGTFGEIRMEFGEQALIKSVALWHQELVAEHPQLGGVVEPDGEGDHHRRQQHQPGERPGKDLEEAPLHRRGERREPQTGDH